MSSCAQIIAHLWPMYGR